jgi:hypothetical protein
MCIADLHPVEPLSEDTYTRGQDLLISSIYQFKRKTSLFRSHTLLSYQQNEFA